MNSGRKPHCFFSVASSVSAFWTSTQSNVWHSPLAKNTMILALVYAPRDYFDCEEHVCMHKRNLAWRKWHAHTNTPLPTMVINIKYKEKYSGNLKVCGNEKDFYTPVAEKGIRLFLPSAAGGLWIFCEAIYTLLFRRYSHCCQPFTQCNYLQRQMLYVTPHQSVCGSASWTETQKSFVVVCLFFLWGCVVLFYEFLLWVN